MSELRERAAPFDEAQGAPSNVEGRERPAFALARYARGFGEVRRRQERSDCLAKAEVRLASGPVIGGESQRVKRARGSGGTKSNPPD